MTPRWCSVALMALLACGCGSGGPTRAERMAAEQAAREAEDARLRAEQRARLEQLRLEALWKYQQSTMRGGAQTTASLFSTGGVDADGRGEQPVQLVFRDHADWGRSSYLVLKAGDFACPPGCTVSVTVDDEAPVTIKARRPNTDEAIALFINDHATLWAMAGRARNLRITFPVKAGGTRQARFEVDALDSSRMPGW
jgi:hypothetical protein